MQRTPTRGEHHTCAPEAGSEYSCPRCLVAYQAEQRRHRIEQRVGDNQQVPVQLVEEGNLNLIALGERNGGDEDNEEELDEEVTNGGEERDEANVSLLDTPIVEDETVTVTKDFLEGLQRQLTALQNKVLTLSAPTSAPAVATSPGSNSSGIPARGGGNSGGASVGGNGGNGNSSPRVSYNSSHAPIVPQSASLTGGNSSPGASNSRSYASVVHNPQSQVGANMVLHNVAHNSLSAPCNAGQGTSHSNQSQIVGVNQALTTRGGQGLMGNSSAPSVQPPSTNISNSQIYNSQIPQNNSGQNYLHGNNISNSHPIYNSQIPPNNSGQTYNSPIVQNNSCQSYNSPIGQNNSCQTYLNGNNSGQYFAPNNSIHQMIPVPSGHPSIQNNYSQYTPYQALPSQVPFYGNAMTPHSSSQNSNPVAYHNNNLVDSNSVNPLAMTSGPYPQNRNVVAASHQPLSSEAGAGGRGNFSYVAPGGPHNAWASAVQFPKLTLPSFSGKPSGMSTREFLTKVKQIKDLVGLPDELFIQRFASSMLIGPALEWWFSLIIKPQSLVEFTDLVKKEFAYQVNDSLIREQLISRKQDRKEGVADFIASMRELMLKMEKPFSPEEQAAYIFRSLHRDFKIHMSEKEKYNNVWELLSHASRVELTVNDIATHNQSEKRGGSQNRDGYYQSNSNRDNGNTLNVGRYSERNSSVPQFENGRGAAFELQCFNCSQKGHKTPNCPTVKCSGCGVMGHIKRYCPKEIQGNSIGGGAPSDATLPKTRF